MEPVLVTARAKDLARGPKVVIDDQDKSSRVLMRLTDRKIVLSLKKRKGSTVDFHMKEGVTYEVWPNHARPLVPVETDTYWPRRWVKETSTHVSHKNYFVFVQSRDGKPKTIEFQTHQCLVNRDWFKTATYDEFCWEMDRFYRQSHYWYQLYETIEEQLEEAFLNGTKRLHVRISDKDFSFGVSVKLTRYSALSALITDNGRIIRVHGDEQIYRKLTEVIWERTYHALREYNVEELLEELKIDHRTSPFSTSDSR